jgi:hypothetical protein
LILNPIPLKREEQEKVKYKVKQLEESCLFFMEIQE